MMLTALPLPVEKGGEAPIWLYAAPAVAWAYGAFFAALLVAILVPFARRGWPVEILAPAIGGAWTAATAAAFGQGWHEPLPGPVALFLFFPIEGVAFAANALSVQLAVIPPAIASTAWLAALLITAGLVCRHAVRLAFRTAGHD